MRLRLLLLGLCGSLEVFALNEAAPFEMYYFYTAYRAEIL